MPTTTILASEHDRRVTELLEANNREVERRRAAEARLAEQPHDQGVYQDDPIGDLRLAARTIRSWIPEVYPADEQGRVPFVRGVLESVAAAIDRAVPVLPPPGPVPMHELPDDEIEALQAYARAHPATAELRAMVGEFQADRAAAERTSDEAAAARAATELLEANSREVERRREAHRVARRLYTTLWALTHAYGGNVPDWLRREHDDACRALEEAKPLCA